MPQRNIKLNYEIACQIREEATGRHGENTALARKYGVNERQIARIIAGTAWKHAGPKDGKKAAISLNENTIHRKIVALLETAKRNDVRFFHVANERICSAREGKMFKLLGVKPGVPDLLIVLASGEVRWLEIKSKNGRLSDAQKDWHEFLNQNGQRAAVVYSFEEAVEILTMWGCFAREVKIAA